MVYCGDQFAIYININRYILHLKLILYVNYASVKLYIFLNEKLRFHLKIIKTLIVERYTYSWVGRLSFLKMSVIPHINVYISKLFQRKSQQDFIWFLTSLF